MKALREGMLAIVVVFCAASQAQIAQKSDARSSEERLIGAWRPLLGMVTDPCT